MAASDDQKWAEIDQQFDRDEGPFDIDEVDLDADDVKRIDLGALVVTPFEGMQLRLQVDQSKTTVQSVLALDGSSGMEVAVFAGPSRTSNVPEIREEILAAASKDAGTAELAEGPFGVEIRRSQPQVDADGRKVTHVTRTWLVHGPGWVLRGVLFGLAATQPNNEEATIALTECFGNMVVRRGQAPAVPGSLIPLTIPKTQRQ